MRLHSAIIFFLRRTDEGCLLTEAFEEACRTGAREAVYRRELYPEYDLLDDGWQQASFVCRNGELGYLRFSNDTAQLIMENLLGDIRAKRARVVVMDVTGVSTIEYDVPALEAAGVARVFGPGTSMIFSRASRKRT